MFSTQHIWLCGLLFMLSFYLEAQVNIDFKLSDKHKDRVAKVTDTRKKLKKYHKLYAKDSLKLSKHYQDSIKKLYKRRLRSDSSLYTQQIPYDLPANTEDSITWALNTLTRHGQYAEVASFYEAYYKMDSLQRPTINPQALESEAAAISDEMLQKNLQSQNINLPQNDPLTGLPKNLNTTKTSLDQSLDLSSYAVQDPTQELDAFQNNLKEKEMAKAQVKLAAMKKKYISMPDMNKPEEGIKRNSLKGQPLINRIYLGGNFNIESTAPLVLDTDFQLGYKFNKKFTLGVGFNWRESLSRKDSLPSNITENGYGYSCFSSYDIAKGFFAYAEYSAVKEASLLGSEKQTDFWQYEYLIGVGKKFSLFEFMDLTTNVLYDINHRNNSLHALPFILRIGYSFSLRGKK